MFEAIRYSLSGLANFSGRDSRSTFWLYMLFLFVIYMILSVVGGLVVAGGMIGGAFEAARGGVDQVEINRQIMGRIETTIRMSAWLNVGVTLVMVALVAASFTRRLHDSNKPGWIGLVIGVMYLAACAYTVGTIEETIALMRKAQSGDAATAQAMQARMAARGLAGWIAPVLFVIFGLLSSSDGDNRYGPEPDHL